MANETYRDSDTLAALEAAYETAEAEALLRIAWRDVLANRCEVLLKRASAMDDPVTMERHVKALVVARRAACRAESDSMNAGKQSGTAWDALCRAKRLAESGGG